MVLSKLEWTKELTRQFWSDLAGTAYLEHTGFSNLSASYLIELVRPFLMASGRHLDFGAGDGFLVGSLMREGYATAAYEPSAKARPFHSSVLDHPLFLGVIGPAAEGKFDVVFMVEVIEHLFDEDVPHVFERIRKLLVDDGILIITTPNAEDLEGSSVYCPVCRNVFHPWQHQRSFTRDSLQAIASSFGFEQQRLHEFDFQDFPHVAWQRQEIAKQLAESWKSKEQIQTGPEGMALDQESLASLGGLGVQKLDPSKFGEAIYQSDLLLGRRTRLVYVGKKSSEESSGNFLREFKDTSASGNLETQEEILKLHNRYVQDYREFVRTFLSQQEHDLRQLKALIAEGAFNTDQHEATQLDSGREPLDQQWGKLREEYRNLIAQMETVPLRKHRHLSLMYSQAMEAISPNAFPKTQGPANEWRSFAREIFRRQVGDRPELIQQYRHLFGQEEGSWAKVSQDFEDYLTLLHRLLELPPYKHADFLHNQSWMIEKSLRMPLGLEEAQNELAKLMQDVDYYRGELAFYSREVDNYRRELNCTQQELGSTRRLLTDTQSMLRHYTRLGKPFRALAKGLNFLLGQEKPGD